MLYLNCISLAVAMWMLVIVVYAVVVTKENKHLETVQLPILQNILLNRNKILYNTVMYRIQEYHKDMDLSTFYQKCLDRGIMNNASPKRLIDTFKQQIFQHQLAFPQE